MDKRQQKRKWQRELAALLAQDDDWHKNPDSELYKQITELGEKLSSTEVKTKEERLRKNVPINKEQFLKLREEGKSYSEIAEHFQATDKRIREWRRENGLE